MIRRGFRIPLALVMAAATAAAWAGPAPVETTTPAIAETPERTGIVASAPHLPAASAPAAGMCRRGDAPQDESRAPWTLDPAPVRQFGVVADTPPCVEDTGSHKVGEIAVPLLGTTLPVRRFPEGEASPPPKPVPPPVQSTPAPEPVPAPPPEPSTPAPVPAPPGPGATSAPPAVPVPAVAPVEIGTVIHFDFDQDRVTAEGAVLLDAFVAKYHAARPVGPVSVTGHADRVGTESYNDGLAMRRARATQSYIAERGVAPTEVSLAARGENDPVTECGDLPRTPLIRCLQPDRRVELKGTVVPRSPQ